MGGKKYTFWDWEHSRFSAIKLGQKKPWRQTWFFLLMQNIDRTCMWLLSIVSRLLILLNGSVAPFYLKKISLNDSATILPTIVLRSKICLNESVAPCILFEYQ